MNKFTRFMFARQRTVFLFVIVFLIRSSAEAQNFWRELPRPTSKLFFQLSFLDSLRGWACGFDGTMMKTTNGGNSWQGQNAGVSTHIHDVYALNDRFGWALTFEHFVDTLTWFGTRILKTTNGGTTWTNQQYPESGEFFNAITFQDSLRGWMAGEFGHLVRTTNGGATWIPVQVDSSIYARWGLVNIRFLTPSYGFVMGGRIDILGVVWRTTNGGLRWTPYEGPPPAEPVHDVHMVDSLHLVGVAGDVDYGASMIRTRNGGELWDYTYLNIFGEPRSLSFRTPSEAWVPLGFAGSLMYTRDTAHTWTAIDTPHRLPIYDLAFTDSLTGFAVGDSGIVLKYFKSADAVAEPLFEVPRTFSLQQNYPNPFNPTTTISYDVPWESSITIKVFNLLGEEVQTLVQQRKEPGRHFVNFNSDNLPSGLYVYRLQAGHFIQSKKMLLLR
jgi:photosystem II stability/assembly factor-like uncharacterized protein